MNSIIDKIGKKYKGPRQYVLDMFGAQDGEDLPIGLKNLYNVLERRRRHENRTAKPRKPAPHFRKELVRRQKKARP